MNVDIKRWPFRETVSMETAVAREYMKLTPNDKADFMGRLLDLLASKGLLSVEEIGQLFYEDWAS